MASPHVAGVAALMLQKNPGLTPAQIEAILESTAMQLSPGCPSVVVPIVGGGNGVGNEPTFSDHSNISYVTAQVCFGANAMGHGLLQADAALNATPLP